MKVKNKFKGTGDRKRKGFYAALSAGAGAVLVLALVLSFSNLTTRTPDPEQLTYDYTDYAEEEVVLAGYDYTQPYLAQGDMDQALFRPRATPTPDPSPAPDPTTTPTPPVPPARQIPQETPAPAETTPTPPGGQAENDSNVSPGEQQNQTPTEEATTQPTPTPAPSPAPRVASFDPLTENDRLLWPVYGDIAMIFSQDRLIYNPTLDQWRTNDDLRISAQEGTPVRASAAGEVVEIGNDREYGNFVRIDNGNGWETILGQLMDGILVVEGDIVQAGQVIGGVGRPSVFSVLNGHHVSLRVLHEDSLMDPKLMLSEIQQ